MEQITGTAWQRVLLARHPKRPHAVDYLRQLVTGFEEIHGDRHYADDPAILCGMGQIDGHTVMLVAQEKGRDTKEKLHRNFGMPKPEGYRKAVRAMRLAEKFKRPIVCLIDTPGAYPGIDAEERGQAEAIAFSMREMATLTVPVVSVVIGEGMSGGAIALGLANRVLMLENAIYTVISPESCAAIIWRDSGKRELAASALRLTAQDLLELGIIDEILPEPFEGAQNDPAAAGLQLRIGILSALAGLHGMSASELVDQRYNRFRQVANFFTEANV